MSVTRNQCPDANYELKCAICGTREWSVILYPQRLIRQEISFISRDAPRKIHFCLLKCERCGLIYSSPIFPPEEIALLYKESEFIEETQIENMKRDYKHQLFNILPLLKRKERLLEIGCASGFFLKAATELGFKEVWGCEVCEKAIKHVLPEFRAKIINAVFSKDFFEAEYFDVVCFFQVLDHIIDPNIFLRDVYRVLRKGGIVLSIHHNVCFLLTKFLGEYSSMYSIGHIFLFNRETTRSILRKTGFDVISIFSIRNRYTLGYCLKMLPFPEWLRQLLLRLAGRWLAINIVINGGNIVSIARK